VPRLQVLRNVNSRGNHTACVYTLGESIAWVATTIPHISNLITQFCIHTYHLWHRTGRVAYNYIGLFYVFAFVIGLRFDEALNRGLAWSVHLHDGVLRIVDAIVLNELKVDNDTSRHTMKWILGTQWTA